MSVVARAKVSVLRVFVLSQSLGPCDDGLTDCARQMQRLEVPFLAQANHDNRLRARHERASLEVGAVVDENLDVSPTDEG